MSSRSKGSKALVTGASGFAGSHRVDFRVEEGIAVAATSRRRPSRRLPEPEGA